MKIAVAGAAGRMGHALIEAAAADQALSVVCAFDSAATGEQVGGVRIVSDPAAVAQADVVLDFTRPEGTLALLKHARAMVIGTTGFTEEDKERIAQAAKRIPIVLAANFAVGVNTVYKLAETAARILGEDYDVEIVEAHHRHKVDAPSGTALTLVREVREARKLSPVWRDRIAESREQHLRGEGSVGVAVMRGGGVVGDHSVHFFGSGERIALHHHAEDRLIFARGALAVATRIRGMPPGRHSVDAVLWR